MQSHALALRPETFRQETNTTLSVVEPYKLLQNLFQIGQYFLLEQYNYTWYSWFISIKSYTHKILFQSHSSAFPSPSSSP